MKNSELITMLSNLPPDGDVYWNWEGEMIPVEKVETCHLYRFSEISPIHIDYFPESEYVDEDEIKLGIGYVIS